MSKPCLLEQRQRAMEAVESGASRREAAEWFDVSPSLAIKWMQRQPQQKVRVRTQRRETAPARLGGDASGFLLAPSSRIWRWMKLSRRCASDGSLAAAAPCGASSSGTISDSKSLRAQQQRADVARARRRWMREQSMFDPARLVFIDETSGAASKGATTKGS